MTIRRIEEVENTMEYYVKMFERVSSIKDCVSTTEELKTYYTKQINKCLEELNAE